MLLVESFSASSRARCDSAEMPPGFDRYRIGSPLDLSTVPWYNDGRNPFDHRSAPALVPGPDCSATNAGKSLDSLPSP